MSKSIINTYLKAGVDAEREEIALQNLIKWIKKTWAFGKDIASVGLDIGFFANVMIMEKEGIALTTDGVGTKILIAQIMEKFDTVAIDCVAMNVNDLLCVGAKPIAMLDYIAVEDVNPRLFEELGRGFYEGARIADIAIPGGEIAQIKEMIRTEKEGFGFDLVGMGIGRVPAEQIIVGQNLTEGDVIIGIESNGIHSNGLTLARRVLLEQKGLKLGDYFEEIGQTLGEELLRPTHIYTREVVEILNSSIDVKALVHITSDGFLNLTRVKADVGFVIDYLPDIPPIFSLIKKLGDVSDEEMFKVYNMGIGFCVVVSKNDANRVISIIQKHKKHACLLGHVVSDREKRVKIEPKGLIGKGKYFYKA